MIPAFVFFYVIKSTAQANGSFPNAPGFLQDVRFQLGGPFAAYFVTVILALLTHNIWNPPQAAQVWHVTGTLKGHNGSGIFPYDMKDVSLYPSPLRPDPSGTFDLTYAVSSVDNGEQYPAISFAYNRSQDGKIISWAAPTISLDPKGADASKLAWDKENHRVNVREIRLEPVDPYTGIGPVTTLDQP